MSDTADDELDDIREQKIEELKSSGATAGPDTDSPNEPVHVNGTDEFESVLSEHPIVLVDFYADWCGPCKMVEPIVETIAAETPATVAKVDVDANQALAQEHGVRGIPALFLVSDGDIVERMTGVQEESTLRSLIDQHASA